MTPCSETSVPTHGDIRLSFFPKTASSSNSNEEQVIIPEEALLRGPENARVVLILPGHKYNKSEKSFLVFCDNPNRIINNKALPVVFNKEVWHQLLVRKEGPFFLGEIIKAVSNYDQSLAKALQAALEETISQPTATVCPATPSTPSAHTPTMIEEADDTT